MRLNAKYDRSDGVGLVKLLGRYGRVCYGLGTIISRNMSVTSSKMVIRGNDAVDNLTSDVGTR